MELRSIKQFSEDQGVSYEAIRSQIKRYSDELRGHIIVNNRTQFLDEWAVDFLMDKRKGNPVIVMNTDRSEENKRLKEQIETLQSQLLTVQNELLKEKDRVILLQDEAKKTIEDRAKYTALLEDNKAKEEQLKEAEDQITEIRKEKEAQDDQIRKIQDEAEDLRRRSAEDQRTIEDLRKERDEAQTEAQSFQKSIFGFYRKR